MKKDRNYGVPYPIYPPYQAPMGQMPGMNPNMVNPNMMGPNMMGQNMMPNISQNTFEQQLNLMQQQINALDKRVTKLEGNSTSTYNKFSETDTSYHMV